MLPLTSEDMIPPVEERMASISSTMSMYISLLGWVTSALRQGMLETVPVGRASERIEDDPPVMACWICGGGVSRYTAYVFGVFHYALLF